MYQRLGAFAVLVVITTGCAQIGDRVTTIENRHMASNSWKSMRDFYKRNEQSLEGLGAVHAYVDSGYLSHVGSGYKAGYLNVATGGSGEPPALPPRRYWTGRYRNQVGHFKTEAWFYGYLLGAQVARQEGVNEWQDVLVWRRPSTGPAIVRSPEVQLSNLSTVQQQMHAQPWSDISQESFPALADPQPHRRVTGSPNAAASVNQWRRRGG